MTLLINSLKALQNDWDQWQYSEKFGEVVLYKYDRDGKIDLDGVKSNEVGRVSVRDMIDFLQSNLRSLEVKQFEG